MSKTSHLQRPFFSFTNSKMPREQRDTLFILGTLAFILLPHLTYLPVWACALTAATLLWRAWLTQGTAKLPGTTVKVTLLALFVGLTAFNFRSIAGPEAGGTLLVMLVSLKTLELRARRDALIIFYLGFFLIMMGFFQSQNIPTAIAMLVALTALIAALVNAHMPAGHPPLWDSIRIALRLMLWGTPIMIALFLTFPRLDPLWSLPNNTLAKTGVSGELSINSIATLAQDTRIAFRVQFEAAAPAQKNLYFRGPVLTYFDGKTWRASQHPNFLDEFSVDNYTIFVTQSPAINYEITQEATNQQWLFTLDLTPPKGRPQLANQRALISSDFQWMVDSIVSERIRYNAQAYLVYQAEGAALSRQSLRNATYLPPDSNPRTQAWGQELMQNPSFAALDSRGKAQWLLDFIRQENFHYTLSPPQGYTAERSADQLWFDYREGFCEHYASAFAVLMRSIGIPTRIVTGYQGAEQNLVDSFWTVRQSNAHAWTEIWQENLGWIRIDPTSAIAPERINNGSMNPAAEINNARTFGDMPFFDKLMMRWDALENSWNQWVLGYSVDSGLKILDSLGFNDASWGTLASVVIGIFATFLLLIYLSAKWRAGRQDHWQTAYLALRKKLQHAGIDSDATTAPRTLAKRVQPFIENKPALATAQKLLMQLEKLRYAPASKQKTTLQEVRRAIKQLHIA